jgi:hypothetical protein
MFVLKEKRLGLLLRSCAQLHLFLNNGQICKRKRGGICWKPELKRLRTRRCTIPPKNKIMESQDLGLCCSSKEDVGKSEEQGRQDQAWRRMK